MLRVLALGTLITLAIALVGSVGLGQEARSTEADPMGQGQGGATGCKVLTAGQNGSQFEDTTSEIKGLSVPSGKYIDAIGILGGPMHGGRGVPCRTSSLRQERK